MPGTDLGGQCILIKALMHQRFPGINRVFYLAQACRCSVMSITFVCFPILAIPYIDLPLLKENTANLIFAYGRMMIANTNLRLHGVPRLIRKIKELLVAGDIIFCSKVMDCMYCLVLLSLMFQYKVKQPIKSCVRSRRYLLPGEI